MEEEGLPATVDESTNKWNALPCLGEETCCFAFMDVGVVAGCPCDIF